MPTAVNEPLEVVLGNYAIKVLDIRNESYKEKKGVWWIRTDDGMRILKKVSNSEETLKYILDAVRHLSNNGVNLPKVHKAKDEAEYVKIGETCYVLTDAIEGRNPSYSSPSELELIAGELGNFHMASKGFRPSVGTKPKFHLGLWIEDYADQLETVNSFYKNELLKSEHDEVNSAIIKEYPYFYERTLRSINALKADIYNNWVSEVKKDGCLCHQDFAAGNLLIAPTGEMYVLDTDSIAIDIPARDIRKLLNKIMKKTGKWDPELTKRIMMYYQKSNPLTEDQWKVVMLDLLFPHLFLGAVNKFYLRRDKEWTNEKYLKRILEMAAFERTFEPLWDNFSSIIPN